MKDREEMLKEDIEELKKELKETKLKNSDEKAKKEPDKQIKEEKKDEKEKKQDKEKKVKTFNSSLFMKGAIPFVIIVILVIGIIIGRATMNAGDDTKTVDTQTPDKTKNVDNGQIVQPVNNNIPILNQCFDNDAGITPDKAGEISFNGQIFDDYCLNNRTVEEYYCDNNQMKVTAESCIFCENNACVKFQSNQEGCLESDAKIDYYVKGFVYDLNKKLGVDTCMGSTLREYYCDSFGYIQDTTKVCDKCEAGRCIDINNQVNACNDSDGVTYDVKGTVTDVTGKKNTDTCHGDKTLEEFYCDGFGYLQSRFKICPYKCVEGACIVAPTV
jgi:hypothetical protein